MTRTPVDKEECLLCRKGSERLDDEKDSAHHCWFEGTEAGQQGSKLSPVMARSSAVPILGEPDRGDAPQTLDVSPCLPVTHARPWPEFLTALDL